MHWRDNSKRGREERGQRAERERKREREHWRDNSNRGREGRGQRAESRGGRG